MIIVFNLKLCLRMSFKLLEKKELVLFNIAIEVLNGCHSNYFRSITLCSQFIITD